MIIPNFNRAAMYHLMEENATAFTLDMDWASDDVIKYSVDFFKSLNVPITLFVTNTSKYLNDQINDENIEFAIHPNFIEGSSQGETHKEIVEYCMKLVPNAKGSRSHRYYDSNDINALLEDSGIRYDSNLCTLLFPLMPFVHRSGLIRFPIFIEDGAYLMHEMNLVFSRISELFFKHNCIRVINIHPMHMFINSPTIGYSREIKDSISRRQMNNISFDEREKYMYQGNGIENFAKEMVYSIIDRRHPLYKLGDIYNVLTER